MGLKDGTTSWFAGIVEAIDVSKSLDGSVPKQYKYQLDDGVIAYVPEDSDAICVSKTPKVVVTALGTFSTTHENAVARDALELVQKLLLNVIKNPDEPKYRIVKLANQKLQTKLFCLSGGIELMQSLGFEKHANEELELPRFKPIATLTRCHVAVQDALDLLARRAVATTPAPADSAPEQPMVPTRQSTITTEMESLWKAQESANVPMLPKRAKSVRSQLIEDLIEELKPIIYSGSSQSETLAIYCAAKAEIERLESLPAGYSAADLLHQRVDAPSPAQSNVFGTPDAMAVVRKLQVPYNWRKGMTLAFEYEDETLLPQRSMSKVVSIAAAAVQKELAEAPATDSVWVGDLPVSWSTFLLPADAAARHLFPLANLSSETNIVDPLSGRSCLAWQPPVSCAGTVEPELLRASELHPLATLGDGNCLLHAAALGAWGVHDQAGTKNVGALRAMVFNLLNNEQFVKIREYAGTEMAISDPSNDDELQEEVQKAQGRAHQSGCYLDKLHIFVLAHAMRRPIVVYHYDSDQPRGSLISGIYLPDLWGELGHRDVCSRVPLCLVFTGTATGQGHFTACVGAEGHALVLPLSDHVHGERLLIRYGPDHVDIRPSGAATTVAPRG
ncbi:zinc finger ran-binding domain-containing protein 1 [Chrysochromulina tobinii]|uniref:Zinc finger ran-binding domain-containing protein 1 n=1 Tax=Chrysochromulina tobinii TaxID=1460289 RepID=A0A0M0K486_9EUKA|nr:zinc finger ran-binding domain-containing protein 1 [Chrysochromulina tobinii]|eukprot:KOO33188.1 zinc finger ran-binding domain-containing protein 1 [Chrysochromulina sp. CCMP291]